jgi:hypothetical protein
MKSYLLPTLFPSTRSRPAHHTEPRTTTAPPYCSSARPPRPPASPYPATAPAWPYPANAPVLPYRLKMAPAVRPISSGCLTSAGGSTSTARYRRPLSSAASLPTRALPLLSSAGALHAVASPPTPCAQIWIVATARLPSSSGMTPGCVAVRSSGFAILLCTLSVAAC